MAQALGGGAVSKLVVVPKSVPAARKALAVMERDLDAAETYEAIRKIERQAEALKALYREVEDVKQGSERVILVARLRVGDELRRAPVATGAREPGTNRGATRSSMEAASLAEQVGSKTRGLNLKKLAEIGREQLLSAASTLWDAGKDATQTAVLRLTRALADKPPEFQESVTAKLKEGIALTEALRQAHKEILPGKILALPSGQYRVIYADPPWKYNDTRTTGDHRQSTGALDHYSDLDLDGLKKLDVLAIAAPDSVLFCWATFPIMPDALSLVGAWGFKYKTAFVWDKGHGSFGHYHDADAELLLVATRGSCLPEADKKEKQIQRFARDKHSAKPEEWRGLIDRLYPSGPRIELFRRGDCPKGWEIWGAEAAEEAA
jgi:N6-adenosine-specific RNA methylase IME4